MKALKHVDAYFSERRLLIKKVALAFMLGAFWIIALRFVTIRSDAVHYHANFAVYVKGERLKLDSPLYYEEVQACGGDEVSNPKIRAHMHNMVSHVVHVHDNGVTWGHFFANIGMTDGDSVFRIDNKIYINSEKLPITYILNGQKVATTANTTIKSKDTLLVSIGAADEQTLGEQYASIEQDAQTYNESYDPSGCSGGKDFSFTERLKKAIGVFGE